MTQHAVFSAPYAPDDDDLLAGLMPSAARAASSTAQDIARDLIEGIRDRASPIGGLEDFLRAYDLSTPEGLALMTMAEALLRIPDAATQDALISDKIGGGIWEGHDGDTWFVSAATWGLGLSMHVVGKGDHPSDLLHRLTRRIGAPAVRTGVRQAMRFLGQHFVLGQTIEEALDRARSLAGKGYRHSYDMLGEGARNWADATRYAASYDAAIEAIGRSAGNAALPDRPGISVKLSALHPRYEPRNREDVLERLVPVVTDLARKAKAYNLNFTIDAEEQTRLELSLEVIAAVFPDPSLREWEGFGLAVQAYGKRAPAVIDWCIALARAHDARMMVRLVKGAYWDSEIKYAQVEGEPDFPVFTRKPATDVSYLACADRMLAARDVLFPQFATHNALTVASLLDRADQTGGRAGFEFQRLHGMGEALFAQVAEAGSGGDPVPARIYAPVGGHRDLLAYLVRRLLENGANASFVSQVSDPGVPIETLLVPPHRQLEAGARHAGIVRPGAIFAPRRNSKGIAWGDRAELEGLARSMRAEASPDPVEPLTPAQARAAMDRAALAFPAWRETTVETRARMLEQAADAMEAARPRLMSILAREAGKTIDDGLAELREAVDFLRYYAAEARRVMQTTRLPGPVGEENLHSLQGRGVFVTIAPWNFPLAIFLGQTAAALVAGNAVVAKPAPQTPCIASEAVRILHAAGIPPEALILAPGGTEVGQALIGHRACAGVAFTGSTATAKAINLQLAQRDGPIVPLIAETGGANAMIADATALPEQVSDAVVTSAFRSAGQRCSACRILYLQDDVAVPMIDMIRGAAAALRLGDPLDPATDIGPIIDAEALARLQDYVAGMQAQVVWQGQAPAGFLAPTLIELAPGEPLTREVFGPVLHIKRFKAGTMPAVLAEIEASGFGLTFALHSRIDRVVTEVSAAAPAGNVYINRNQIGAIVGSQPFGGRGLSGTGPKAGGPLYLTRFVEERVVSTDTTAAGGNAALIALSD